MDRLTTRKPPSLRRGIATGLGIALVVSVLGFSNDASEFAATFLPVSAFAVGSSQRGAIGECGYYVNIHTPSFSAGAVRGQLSRLLYDND